MCLPQKNECLWMKHLIKREAGATFVNQMTDWYDFTDNDTEVNQLH